MKFGKRGRESNVNQNHCRKQTSQDKKRLIKQTNKTERKEKERKKKERKKKERKKKAQSAAH